MACAVATYNSRQLGNAAGAVAEPLLIAPSYTPSQRDMRGLILSSFLKNVPQKTSKSRKQFIGKDYLLHLSGMLAML